MLRQARLDALGTLHFECLRNGVWIEGKKIFKFIQKQDFLGHFNDQNSVISG
jgi:hypothetical protein